MSTSELDMGEHIRASLSSSEHNEVSDEMKSYQVRVRVPGVIWNKMKYAAEGHGLTVLEWARSRLTMAANREASERLARPETVKYEGGEEE